MSAEEPETEAGAANDATEVVGDDFTTRLGKAASGTADAQPGQAWSDEDEDADDAEQRESHPWSVVTGQAAALISVGAAVAAITVLAGWMMLHKDRAAPSPAPLTSTAEKNTSPTAAAAPAPAPTGSAASPTTSQPPPSSQPVAAAPPLDGIYSLEGQDLTPMLYGFRFACAPPTTRPLGPATECNATGAQLDSAIPNAQAGPPYNDPDALRWADGRWQSAEQTRQYQCSRTGEGGDTTYTTTRSMSLEPQSSDGSNYRGTLVQTVLANECSMQVGTERSIFAARRIGPRPPHANW
jgi:type IV secretory pathway VirB10-like protein